MRPKKVVKNYKIKSSCWIKKIKNLSKATLVGIVTGVNDYSMDTSQEEGHPIYFRKISHGHDWLKLNIGEPQILEVIIPANILEAQTTTEMTTTTKTTTKTQTTTSSTSTTTTTSSTTHTTTTRKRRRKTTTKRRYNATTTTTSTATEEQDKGLHHC